MLLSSSRHLRAVAFRPNYKIGQTLSTTSSLPSAGPCFRLSEDQLQVQHVARQFARNEVMPVAAELDRSGAYPFELMQRAWKLGLLNGHVPEKYGGLGLDCLTGCVAAEELAYGCAGVETALKVSDIGVGHTHLSIMNRLVLIISIASAHHSIR